MSKYKEENRQILKESIEVAPFTAKIQRTSDPGMDRDRERCRDPAFPVRIPALASPNPKAGHAHPHVIQSEKSNYFTTLSNSVVNEPPRLYPSKELSSYYEKVSAGAPAVVASVGATMPSQGALSLGSYSSKASLSKPPPLIKHQPEGGEGLAGKITEQLSQQVTIVQQQHQHHTSIDRIERRSPAISPSSSTSSSFSSAPNHHHHHHQQQQQQHQLRAMPSLHRAPVFHPPTQHALERKEAAEREKERERERERAGYGGRLSPPTLTPIQPVSLASAGNKTLAEQQKPPTLLPELRDIKGHGNTAVVTSVASAISGEIITSSTDGWRGGEMIQEREGSFSGEKGVARGKPQAAMASVIVHPSTSIKYDSLIGANKCGAMIHKEFPQGRFYPSNSQGECPRLGESIKEPGVSRIIQPNSNLDDMSVQYKKTSVRGMQGTMGASAINSVCRTAISAASAFGKSGTSIPELGYSVSARGEISTHKSGPGGWVLSHSGPGEHQEGLGSRTTSPGGSLPPPSPAGTPQPSPSLTPTPSSISGSSQPYSSSFVHLKKHKAALAAAQSRSNFSIAPTSITTGNSPLTVDSVDKAPIHNSPPPPSSSQASSSSVDSSSSSSASGSTTPGKSSPLPNGHTSGSASTSSGQPSNYHKLKKAWLTRHSEEDRNTTTTTSSTSSKPEKLPSTTTSTNNTAAMSEMIKPCTVNLSASTSSEVEMSKDSGSKVERERQLEEKVGGATGGGEERKAAPSSRRGNKRPYDSGSESGGDDSDASESKMEGRAKRQPKPTYKKKQNDMAKKKGDNEKEEDDLKPNGIFRSAREKTKLKLASSSKSYLCRHLLKH